MLEIAVISTSWKKVQQKVIPITAKIFVVQIYITNSKFMLVVPYVNPSIPCLVTIPAVVSQSVTNECCLAYIKSENYAF